QRAHDRGADRQAGHPRAGGPARARARGWQPPRGLLLERRRRSVGRRPARPAARGDPGSRQRAVRLGRPGRRRQRDSRGAPRRAGGSTTLRYTRYGGEFKLLEAEGPETGEEGGPERKLSDDRVQLAGNYVLGGLRLETKAQWQRHSLIEVADTGTSAGGTPLEGTAFDLLLNTLTVDVLAHHTAGPRARGTVGASGFYQTNDTRGPIPLVPDARTGSGAVFAFEEAAFGRMSVLAGGRVDLRHLTADPNATLGLSQETRDYTTVSGNAGVVYRPAATMALTANVGHAWRAPTLFELFSNGPHLGEARYEIGDANLE